MSYCKRLYMIAASLRTIGLGTRLEMYDVFVYVLKNLSTTAMI